MCAHLFLLFVLAKMIIHRRNTLGKHSWKEMTKKYREGIWLSFCSQRNYIQDRKQCHEIMVKEHHDLHHGRKTCVGCQCVPASSGHKPHEHLRDRNGPKHLKSQRHQQRAQPAWRYHGWVYLIIFWTQTIISWASVSGCPPRGTPGKADFHTAPWEMERIQLLFLFFPYSFLFLYLFFSFLLSCCNF